MGSPEFLKKHPSAKPLRNTSHSILKVLQPHCVYLQSVHTKTSITIQSDVTYAMEYYNIHRKYKLNGWCCGVVFCCKSERTKLLNLNKTIYFHSCILFFVVCFRSARRSNIRATANCFEWGVLARRDKK